MEKDDEGDAGTVRLKGDPTPCESHEPQASGEPHAPHEGREAARDPSGVYREVQRSAAFREVRGRYRGFAFPVTVAFLGWYLGYLVLATAAPQLMARPVAGAINVAMLLGLGQFATTFLLTWAYARHARLRRDPEALELRWAVALETQQGPARAGGRVPPMREEAR
ncbi:DUF485 domain-containing protein [Streptomyces netropsis]|uniref:Uncharacterized membrane protein (DUF485 family) n=1 Tax=Streptomyces netropsis TaxID=55404 RepID=A0A7W7LGX6_STRNE|nr:DUF485 domain-containing protein [Streptomyces netropsis]MBB4889844.1 uncharacterized membrane protein (DUF485 family) [Streptomyces netropsis]GGR41517.1 hypothetical protein GCM10010219_53490 [Streptomyces netropsis]